VGNKLETDIKFGIDCRFYTLAVLSGQTTEKMLKASDIDPDFVLPSLNDIVDYLDD
ncbi:MAG: HAD hydrolase-like protein, partial [Clostridia bacterium]|nr:HAD hydrolase-like protein [Clostridia bacterium]